MPPSVWSDPNADVPDDEETHGVEEVDFEVEEKTEGNAPEGASSQPFGPTIISDAELSDLLRKTYADMREAITASPLFKPIPSGVSISRATFPVPAEPVAPVEVDDVFRGVKWSAEGFAVTAPAEPARNVTKWGGRAVEWDVVRRRGVLMGAPARPRSPFWRNPFVADDVAEASGSRMVVTGVTDTTITIAPVEEGD